MSRARDIANLQSSKITADAGIDIDNINIDGTEIDLSSGDLTIDVAADIHLDAGGGDINFKVGGTPFGFVAKYNDDLWIGSSISDGDLAIRGNDADGGNFTALSFDMSDQGTATFNHDVKMGDLCYLLLGAGNDLELVGDGTNGKIAAANGNLTLDVAGDIELNADGNEITFKHGSDLRYEFKLDSTPEMNVTGGNFTIQNQTDDGDILFKGSDAGSGITALTLDMGDLGKALFKSGLSISSNDMPNVAAASIYHDSSNRLRITGGTAGYLFMDDTNGTTHLKIDDSGRIGVHQTPHGWNTGTSGRVPIQIGHGSFSGRINDMNTEISNNCYASGTGNDPQWAGMTRYQKQQIEMDNGGNIIFKNAPVVDQSTFDSSPNFSWVDRMTISLNGDVGVGTSSWFPGSTAYKFVSQTDANQVSQVNYASNASYTSSVHQWDTIKAGNSNFMVWVVRTNVGGSIDTELNFNGAGAMSIDGTLSENGADYAEYFEWKDGNSDSEDRVGITVKLDGDKIVPSTSDDNASVIIGVISGKPSVVGDSAWNKWKNKHETDDYGRYIWEEYTVTEWTIPATDTEKEVNHTYPTDYIPSDLTVPSDATVISKEEDGTNLMRRKLNSSYNPSTTYIPREQRPEWAAVGMMGKLRIRKGQTVGDRWIKMRDVSSSVEEWLVK